VFAPFDLPHFSNSSMDGYAVRAEDVAAANLENPVTLQVIGEIPAGADVLIELAAGQAIRIMTGGPIPPGSDAVVPIEQTIVIPPISGTDNQSTVAINKPVQSGEYIRPKGEDVSAGDMVLQAGSRLRPQDVSFLAMLGIGRVKIHRPPKVAIFSSGDELLSIGETLSYGKIYNSNSCLLQSLVEYYGGQVIDLGIAADTFEDVHQILEECVKQGIDLILSSAGVSVGERDFVRAVMESYGELGFWRVNMRPGKPLTFGHYKELPFIGLPGNPVSAFVGFEVFVRPVLLKLAGARDWERSSVSVIIDDPIESDGRESYLRASIEQRDGEWRGKLTGHQGSGNLYSLVKANALLLIPSGVKSLPVGSKISGWLLDY
jgi:molybdopterin molybdotransferase